ncbi:hypothetical protein SUGI_1023780 [Cryptomeria japonica]|uniref:UDP-glycosyltransferase 83A1-like n=1 Tax=Cryptomeria japonica TaxID=3369 RepID=UPI002414A3A4|nr:UDP-glycosyltransferase 83A1-like [Cryptomeria japonica]GLJ48521.1 hypothetical protein SUGI_1023780 [Cryptomeria japonica]
MGEVVGEKPHALLVPFPLQGHINPMMQLAKKLVSDGFIVTFVNNESNHYLIMKAKKKMESTDANKEEIRMVSLPNNLPPEVPQDDVLKLLDLSNQTLACSLRKLIQDINEKEAHKVTCLIFDLAVFFIKEVAKHFDIPYAIFSPVSVATAATCHMPSRLISSGILSSNGTAQVNKTINALPSMPPLHSTQFAWMLGTEDEIQKTFQSTLATEKQVREDIIIFNSSYDLEAAVIKEYPEKGVALCPIGPLIPEQTGHHTRAGTLRTEDLKCLDWLHKQRPLSVLYVAFGSLELILNEKQLQELALGLEATGRPFLWVLRSDFKAAMFPPGFVGRVGDRGCLVSWAPQLSVLSHPSIACFITHCGWNSTVESISIGVPLLCWPQSMDQFLNCSYIVNHWKIGLELVRNAWGIVEKEVLQKAVEKLLIEDDGIEMKKRVIMLKNSVRASVREEGSSCINYKRFLEAMKSNLEYSEIVRRLCEDN